MRVGLISDIHGNLLALEKVLADLDRDRPDQILCLGDVVALGPQPLETLERLRGLDYPTVMGNTDVVLLSPIPDEEPVDEHMSRIVDMYRWCAGKLSDTDLDYLGGFEPVLEVTLDHGNTLLCFHGSPYSFNDVIVAATAGEDLDQMLSGYEATIMAGGHTHIQLARRHRNSTVLNPGSVGLDSPFQAEYAVIDSSEGGLSIELRRLPLDHGEVTEIALQSGMPHSDWWSDANRWADW